MTTREARGMTPAEIEEESVARYLQHNLDFFERNQPLLARLRLPHARTNSTISLVERQVEVLRERHAAIEQKLADFVNVARANDAVADKIHRMTRRLLRADSREASIREVEASLRGEFDSFTSAQLLIGSARAPDGERFRSA